MLLLAFVGATLKQDNAERTWEQWFALVPWVKITSVPFCVEFVRSPRANLGFL